MLSFDNRLQVLRQRILQGNASCAHVVQPVVVRFPRPPRRLRYDRRHDDLRWRRLAAMAVDPRGQVGLGDPAPSLLAETDRGEIAAL
jgi:hypothetical protein